VWPSVGSPAPDINSHPEIVLGALSLELKLVSKTADEQPRLRRNGRIAGTSTMFRHLPVFSCKEWMIPKRKQNKPPTYTFSNGSSGLGSGKPL
jgi:hypothetical protein